MKDETERSWKNPYRARCLEFPGRLFDAGRTTQNLDALRQLILGSSRRFCEIGSGSGRHLIELARRNPQALVLGCELRFKRAVRTIEKSQTLNVENTVVCRMRGELIGEIFPERSLEGIYINYPDPWAKSRWHKHRILSRPFLELAGKLLCDGGFLSVKTDHAEYFASFLECAVQSPEYTIEEHSDDLKNSAYFPDNISTEFEEMFIHQGLPLCYAKLLRR